MGNSTSLFCFFFFFFSSYFVYASCWCSNLLFVLQAPNVTRKDVCIWVNYYKNGEYVLRIWGSIMNKRTSRISGYSLAFCLCVWGAENMSIFGSNTHRMIWSGLGSVLGFPCGSDGKESACNTGDLGSISGSGRSPGERNGNPLQYSCLENLMDRGAWQTIVREVTNNQTWLSN